MTDFDEIWNVTPVGVREDSNQISKKSDKKPKNFAVFSKKRFLLISMLKFGLESSAKNEKACFFLNYLVGTK